MPQRVSSFEMSGHVPQPPQDPFLPLTAKKWKPTAAKIREWASVANNPGKASFKCPKCKESFVLGYGRFIESWLGSHYECRQCAPKK